MRHAPLRLLIGLLAVAAALADEGVHDLPAVVVECSLGKTSAQPEERITVAPTITSETVPESRTEFVKQFDPPNGQEQKATFRALVGHSVECVYPSGHRVRVKVGSGVATPYGRCGGDAQIFFSIWVDRKKVASREWFSGHCYEGPAVSYDVTPGTARRCERDQSFDELGRPLPAKGKDPVRCTAIPTSDLTVDVLEYPPAAAQSTIAGGIELELSTDAVCAAVRHELVADGTTFDKYGPEKPPSLERPDWKQADIAMHEDVRGIEESWFDFDNDGTTDHVSSLLFESSYMDGTALLVGGNPGGPPSNGWFIPCQLTSPVPFAKCPPFSQENDEYGITIHGRGGREVGFQGRYTTLTPFRFRSTTYVALSSDSGAEVAVIRPQPGRRFEQVCFLRWVNANF